MKILLLLLSLLALCIPLSRGSEVVLITVYQPLDGIVDNEIRVCSVPLVTSGSAFPRACFSAITQPHIPQQYSAGSGSVGDINMASRVGLSIRCESATADEKKFHIIWDFSKADTQQVTDKLIDALIECLKKSAGKSIGLYSKFEGEKNFAAFKARILAKIPAQTAERLKKDSGKK